MNRVLTDLLKPVTLPASWAYGATIAQRNRGFDRGRRVTRLDRPVISVGNISVGGVGKSPLVAWIAALLRDEGHRPCIAMRGYASQPGEMGDEEAEYRERLEDIHVVADPDRAAALGRFLPRHPDVDVVLLDDGFQHRFVQRDLDLVLIDASRDTFGDLLLPAGRLREPLANLARADAVIVTRAASDDEIIAAKVKHHHGRPPLAWCDHHWSHLRVFASGVPEAHEGVGWLNDKVLTTMLGVGHPKSVISQLEQAGARVMANLPVADHERYDRARISVARGLCEGTDGFVLTGKDWVKARHLIDLDNWPVPIIVPHLELDMHHGADELRKVILKAVAEFKDTSPLTHNPSP